MCLGFVYLQHFMFKRQRIYVKCKENKLEEYARNSNSVAADEIRTVQEVEAGSVKLTSLNFTFRKAAPCQYTNLSFAEPNAF